MLSKVFKAYDVRATYPEPLNEEIAWKVGFASAQFLLDRVRQQGLDGPMMKHIVVGHDMRKSSPSLLQALKDGIHARGVHTIDVGMVDTPFIYFAINHLDCCGGIQVTASHNPSNYNGFKVSQVAAKPVGSGSGLEVIQEIAEGVDPNGPHEGGGQDESMDLWAAYREHLHQFLADSLLDGTRTLKVAIDASNGMAGTMVPKVFGDVPGLQIVPINFDNSTGEFVHEPNPIVESNLAQLREAVGAESADVGICFDGDADRCVVVDQDGRPIGCDILLAWLAQDALAAEPGATFIYDLRSSHAVPETIRSLGGTGVESRVGHVYMKAALNENNAVMGGELSGHFYFRDMFCADSGARAFAAVMTGLAHADKPLSKLIDPLMKYVQSGEINFRNEDKEGALAALEAAFPDARTEHLDGLTLELDDFWCNVRMSNTEPLLRLNLEAADPEVVTKRLEEISPLLGERVQE
ncbi:MAG: hypothetical protein CMJ32_01435 [Phycisphaerae bacterium]|nr:hypothetical protein [Phycisphaerae bacterium]